MGIIASERVFKVLDNEDYADDKGSYAPDTVKGKMEFEKVWFAYTDDTLCAEGYSFEAKPGETIAIVGSYRQRKDHHHQFAEPALPYTKRQIKVMILILKIINWMFCEKISGWCCRMFSCSPVR